VANACATAFGGGILTVNSVSPPSFANPSFVSGMKFSAQVNGVVATTARASIFSPARSPASRRLQPEGSIT